MIIGITGGIGSGKSTIAQELARRGYTVYDCDREAKRIVTEDSRVRQAVIALLGTEAFTTSPAKPFTGVYNTAYVAKRVFAEPELLAQLNAIVHPAVTRDIKARGEQLKPHESLFIESAILFEAGLDALCDRVIVVDAPENMRIARTIARDYQGEATPANIKKVRARMMRQPAASRHPYSHKNTIVLMNDGTYSISALAEKIIALL